MKIEQVKAGATDKVANILEELVHQVDRLTSKGLLPEGDIEGLEKAAGHAELFLRPQSEEYEPALYQLSDAHFNRLTPAQAERLAILMEEMAEASQVIGKILRHGFDSCHPKDKTTNNRGLLLKELTDVQAAMVLVSLDVPALRGDTEEANQRVVSAVIKKLEYCHHQAEFEDFAKAAGLL